MADDTVRAFRCALWTFVWFRTALLRDNSSLLLCSLGKEGNDTLALTVNVSDVVGLEVGSLVGGTVAGVVGGLVGFGLGTTVGFTIGLGVGASVGASVGAKLGRGLWYRAGVNSPSSQSPSAKVGCCRGIQNNDF